MLSASTQTSRTIHAPSSGRGRGSGRRRRSGSGHRSRSKCRSGSRRGRRRGSGSGSGPAGASRRAAVVYRPPTRQPVRDAPRVTLKHSVTRRRARAWCTARNACVTRLASSRRVSSSEPSVRIARMRRELRSVHGTTVPARRKCAGEGGDRAAAATSSASLSTTATKGRAPARWPKRSENRWVGSGAWGHSLGRVAVSYSGLRRTFNLTPLAKAGGAANLFDLLDRVGIFRQRTSREYSKACYETNELYA
jgi:hypothetical protein